jgi:hypothetical protein
MADDVQTVLGRFWSSQPWAGCHSSSQASRSSKALRVASFRMEAKRWRWPLELIAFAMRNRRRPYTVKRPPHLAASFICETTPLRRR